MQLFDMAHVDQLSVSTVEMHKDRILVISKASTLLVFDLEGHFLRSLMEVQHTLLEVIPVDYAGLVIGEKIDQNYIKTTVGNFKNSTR